MWEWAMSHPATNCFNQLSVRQPGTVPPPETGRSRLRCMDRNASISEMSEMRNMRDSRFRTLIIH
jgi:hypothetical protein